MGQARTDRPPGARPALVEIEAGMREAEEILGEHESRKLRLLLARRWRLVEPE